VKLYALGSTNIHSIWGKEKLPQKLKESLIVLIYKGAGNFKILYFSFAGDVRFHVTKLNY
jgi:hypothetical protein